MVAIAVRAPFKHKGGGAHGGVVVLVAIVDTVFENFKGTPKVWSRYWSSPAFRRTSGDIPHYRLILIPVHLCGLFIVSRFTWVCSSGVHG
jgi:hypothetical protein